MRFLAKTCGRVKWKTLKCAKRRLTFGHSDGWAGHCNKRENILLRSNSGEHRKRCKQWLGSVRDGTAVIHTAIICASDSGDDSMNDGSASVWHPLHCDHSHWTTAADAHHLSFQAIIALSYSFFLPSPNSAFWIRPFGLYFSTFVKWKFVSLHSGLRPRPVTSQNWHSKLK